MGEIDPESGAERRRDLAATLNERLFISSRHVMYSLRGGFLVRPLIIAATLGCAGALLSALEEALPGLGAWASNWRRRRSRAPKTCPRLGDIEGPEPPAMLDCVRREALGRDATEDGR